MDAQKTHQPFLMVATKLSLSAAVGFVAALPLLVR